MQAVYIFHITYYRNKTHDIHYNAEKKLDEAISIIQQKPEKKVTDRKL